ncbi:MAG: hypothetical protein SGBAC_012804 [Bacillariaceae sp.]
MAMTQLLLPPQQTNRPIAQEMLANTNTIAFAIESATVDKEKLNVEEADEVGAVEETAASDKIEAVAGRFNFGRLIRWLPRFLPFYSTFGMANILAVSAWIHTMTVRIKLACKVTFETAKSGGRAFADFVVRIVFVALAAVTLKIRIFQLHWQV